MVSSRARALALVGAAAFLPLLSSAQESRLPRVDLTTPLDKVNELSQLARVRELRHTMLNIFYHTMGAPVTLVKRTGLKADYYDAWRARIHDRAFPKGVIDPSMYTRAVDRRRSMAPAPVMGVGKKGAVNRVTGLADASGALWEPVGPFKTRVPYVQYYGPATSYVSGRVGGIAFDPIDSNIVYKTGSAGGVFKTTNGGVNWTPLVNGIQAPYLSAIAVSPHNRNIVLAGSGDFDGGVGVGDGLYRSINGGASWSLVAKSQIGNVAFSDIVFDPTTPGRVLATTGRRGILNGKYSSGLWESKDYGSTWTKRYITKPVTPETMSLGSISFGAADATGKRTVVMAREYPAGVFVSRDTGKTWAEIVNYPGRNQNARTVAAASPTNPNVVYVADDAPRSPDGDGRIFKGTRVGTTSAFTWQNISNGHPGGYNWSQSSYDMHIAAAKHTVNGVARDTVYVGLITIAAYNGTAWNDIGASYTGNARTHNDQHTFAVFPGDSSKMAFGNDGGIYGLTISPNGTHTINANMNGDSSMAMFYSGAWHPTDPNRMFGGTQDNASPTAIGNLSQWSNRTGGDGTGAAIDGQNPNRQYGAAQFLSMYATTNAWNSQFFLRDGFDDPAGLPFIGRFAADKSPQGMLYVGSNSQLHQYNASTGVWTDYLGEQDFVGQPRAIAVAPTDPNTIYVGTTAGRLYVSRDRGETWTELPGSGALGVVTSFSIHPTKPRDVLMTAGSNVYRISDLPSPPFPPNTVNVSQVSGFGGGALPTIFTSAVARNQNAPDTTWYITNDVGVFGTVNGGLTWFNMTESLGLPPVEGSALEHTPGTGYLNLATYGRGMWRLKLDDLQNPALMGVTGTIRRTAYNVVAVTLRITNNGAAPATMAKVTLADLYFPSSSYRAFTIAPLNMGTIAPGSFKEVVVTYRDDFLRGSGLTGIVVPNITWTSGTQTIGYNGAVQVTLP